MNLTCNQNIHISQCKLPLEALKQQLQEEDQQLQEKDEQLKKISAKKEQMLN